MKVFLLVEQRPSFLFDVHELNEINKQMQSLDYVHPLQLTKYESIPTD